jgi:hypothetical protein
MALYIPINVEPVEVKNLVYNTDSQSEIIAFLEGHHARKGLDGSVHLPGKGNIVTGDWVILHKSGELEVISSDEEFAKKYKPFQPSTVNPDTEK